MALGIGLSVNQSKAVIEALVGYQTPFTRTPKLGVGNDRKHGLRSDSREVSSLGSDALIPKELPNSAYSAHQRFRSTRDTACEARGT